MLYVSCCLTLINRVGAEPLNGIDDLDYRFRSGPQFFDELVSSMAEDVLDISSASARRLYSAFEIAYRGSDVSTNIVKLHPLAPLQPLNETADQSEVVASRVAVNTSSGVCPRTQAKLRLIKLETDERKLLQSSLRELARTQFDKVTKDRQVDIDAAEQFDIFANWLE